MMCTRSIHVARHGASTRLTRLSKNYPKMNKQSSHYELFNLKDDFAESQNLADSNPEKEYQETLDKAAAMIQALSHH